MKVRLIFILLSILITVGACKKDEPDAEVIAAPKITILSTSVPTTSKEVCDVMYDNVLQLTTGIPLTIKMKLEGSNGLSQYKIDIHNNFDCHAHERTFSAWTYLKVEDISGNALEVTEEIPLPVNAFSGNYHCIIRLIDNLGNESDFVEFNLVVSNASDSIAPVITYTLPASDSIAVRKGDIITFKGLVTDNASLQGGKLEISYVDAGGNDYNAIQESFSTEDSKEHEFNRTYEVPAYIAYGTALFTFKANDKSNNVGEKSIKVHVIE